MSGVLVDALVAGVLRFCAGRFRFHAGRIFYFLRRFQSVADADRLTGRRYGKEAPDIGYRSTSEVIHFALILLGVLPLGNLPGTFFTTKVEACRHATARLCNAAMPVGPFRVRGGCFHAVFNKPKVGFTILRAIELLPRQGRAGDRLFKVADALQPCLKARVGEFHKSLVLLAAEGDLVENHAFRIVGMILDADFAAFRVDLKGHADGMEKGAVHLMQYPERDETVDRDVFQSNPDLSDRHTGQKRLECSPEVSSVRHSEHDRQKTWSAYQRDAPKSRRATE